MVGLSKLTSIDEARYSQATGSRVFAIRNRRNRFIGSVGGRADAPGCSGGGRSVRRRRGRRWGDQARGRSADRAPSRRFGRAAGLQLKRGRAARRAAAAGTRSRPWIGERAPDGTAPPDPTLLVLCRRGRSDPQAAAGGGGSDIGPSHGLVFQDMGRFRPVQARRRMVPAAARVALRLAGRTSGRGPFE